MREAYKQLFFTPILIRAKYAFKLARIYDCMCYYGAADVAMNRQLVEEWDDDVDTIFRRLQEVDRGAEKDIDIDFIRKYVNKLKPFMKNIDIDETMNHLMSYIIRTISKIDEEIRE